jgi:hypothetical protein
MKVGQTFCDTGDSALQPRRHLIRTQSDLDQFASALTVREFVGEVVFGPDFAKLKALPFETGAIHGTLDLRATSVRRIPRGLTVDGKVLYGDIGAFSSNRETKSAGGRLNLYAGRLLNAAIYRQGWSAMRGLAGEAFSRGDAATDRRSFERTVAEEGISPGQLRLRARQLRLTATGAACLCAAVIGLSAYHALTGGLAPAQGFIMLATTFMFAAIAAVNSYRVAQIRLRSFISFREWLDQPALWLPRLPK